MALTAGVAALWLAHHGRANLIAIARAQGETLQSMFRRLVQATARRPSGWDSSDFGAGIVDAAALLGAELDLGLDAVAPPAAAFDTHVAGMVAEAVGPEAALDPGWTGAGTDPSWHTRCSTHSSGHRPTRKQRDQGPPSGRSPTRCPRRSATPALRDWLGLDGRTGPEVAGE